MPANSELSFFSALRNLRHLFSLLEKQKIELHSSCDDCDEVEKFMTVERYRGNSTGDWESAFSSALNGLKHLYFRLEEAKGELHSTTCWGCIEIRNFLNIPGYLGNQKDPVGVKYHRPLTEYGNDYENAVIAEKSLRTP